MAGKVGEFLNLLVLSASVEDQEAAAETEDEKEKDYECNEQFDHGWSHGTGAAAARVASDDESGDDCHC